MQRLEHRFTAMGGPCTFRVEHADEDLCLQAIERARQCVTRLEQKFSRYLPDSLVSQINARAGSGEPIALDDETVGILNYADTLWQQSEGRFDLTAGVLRRAWDFRSGMLPPEEELAKLRALIGWERVEWNSESVLLPEAGMELDFGGCVKEYAADAAVACMAEIGVCHTLVELAGDIAVGGPAADGTSWKVGIQHPRQTGVAIAEIALHRGGLATSGDYQRCIEIDGRRYGHILNARTGWPEPGPLAVSVQAPQCLVAGSAATIAMLKPLDDALRWLEDLGLSWLAVDADLNCHGSYQT